MVASPKPNLVITVVLPQLGVDDSEDYVDFWIDSCPNNLNDDYCYFRFYLRVDVKKTGLRP